LLLLVDSSENVARVAALLDRIEGTARPQWAIQLHLVTLSQRDILDLGLDTTPALDLAVSQAAGSSAGVSPVRLDASLRTVLRAAQDRSTVSVTAQPLFLLLDGERAEFTRGTSIPIPRRAVSDQGTVTTTGYEHVQVGTNVAVEIREQTADAVRLTLSVDLSDLVEVTVDGLPRTDRRSYNASCSVVSGGTYLVASIEIGENREGRGTWLHWGDRRDNSQEVLQVWARAMAVSGPALSASSELPPVVLPPPQAVAGHPSAPQSQRRSPVGVASPELRPGVSTRASGSAGSVVSSSALGVGPGRPGEQPGLNAAELSVPGGVATERGRRIQGRAL
jgi:hypothetical protein